MHEPKSRVAIEALTCLLRDFESITGMDMSKDMSYLEKLHSKNGNRGLLTVLQQHKEVLYAYFSVGLPLRPGVVRSQSKSQPVPLLLKQVWEKLYDESEDHSKWVSLLMQAFSLLSKWDSPTPVDEGCEEKFLARVGSRAYASKSLSSAYWLTEIQRIIGRWFERCPQGSYHTSSGACFDHRSVLERPLVFSRSSRFTLPDPETPGFLFEDVSPINRLCVVPKDWRRSRVVCVEHAGRVNVQQYARTVIESVASHTDLGQRINFLDQGHQRSSLRLPGRSSIDLSDASDYVDACVIWRCFRNVPLLRSILFSSRSTKVLFEGKEYPIRCYATMGNATTFAVMSVFLCALTKACEEYAYHYSGRRAVTSTVFGDDIICDDWIAGTVLTVLREFGFRVNTAKTFIGRRFKESCGVDLFDDVDVTPLKLKGLESADQASLVDRVIDYSNRAHKAGYWRLADYIRRLARTRLPCNFGERSLFSFSSGFQLSGTRWDPGYQNFIFPASQARLIQSDSLQNYLYTLNKVCSGRQDHDVWPRLRESVT